MKTTIQNDLIACARDAAPIPDYAKAFADEWIKAVDMVQAGLDAASHTACGEQDLTILLNEGEASVALDTATQGIMETLNECIGGKQMAISETALRKWEQAKAETPRPVRNINEKFGDPVIDDSLADMYAAVAKLDEMMPDEGPWMPDDGLVEGRDFVYVEPMLMNPFTGSVAPESEWRKDYEYMMQQEDGDCLWGGKEFDDAGLVEVRRNENGDWVRV
jgi:hypothetical protein